MKKLYHTSRLFRSVHKPPTIQDALSRQYPIVETYNEVWQEHGLAQIGVVYGRNGPDCTYFSIITFCGDRITHWRWKEFEEGERIPL